MVAEFSSFKAVNLGEPPLGNNRKTEKQTLRGPASNGFRKSCLMLLGFRNDFLFISHCWVVAWNGGGHMYNIFPSANKKHLKIRYTVHPLGLPHEEIWVVKLSTQKTD